MDRTPTHRRPDGADGAFAVPAFQPAATTKSFRIPATIQADFEKWLMTDMPGTNFTFELVRDWYAREAADYEAEFLRAMYFAISWKSKINNSDVNSNFKTHTRVDIRKGDILIREDGLMLMLNWAVQRNPNNQSSQAVQCNAFVEFTRDVDEVLDPRGYVLEPAHSKVIAPMIPCSYSEYAGRPDYATAYNTPGVFPDHLLTCQMQYNDRTKNLRINDKFTLMHSTYHIVHLMESEVDIDKVYGLINLVARKSAGEDRE